MSSLFEAEELDPFAEKLYMSVRLETDDAADMVNLYYKMCSDGYSRQEIINALEDNHGLPSGQLTSWLLANQSLEPPSS